MNYSNLSLTSKLVLSICGIISLILVGLSIFFIDKSAAENEAKIQSAISKVASDEANNIKQLLSNRYYILKTTFETPTLQKWISSRENMWEPLEQTPYQNVNKYLQHVVNTETDLTSLFYAPMQTREYWDENGRIPQKVMVSPIEEVPWWKKTIDAGKPVVNEPFEDSRTRVVSAAITMPVLNKDQQQIAIAGVDLKLKSIQDYITNNAKYEGNGHAFLFQSSGELITLPPQTKINSRRKRLSDLENISGNKGFNQLKNSSTQVSYHQLIWQDKEQLVVVAPVELSTPKMQWRLAIMYPKQLVEEPIKQTTLILVFITLGLVSAVAMILIYLIRVNLKPLKEIGQAMEQIVNGDGDLTLRLSVKNEDEIGVLAKLFNQFVVNVHNIVKDSLVVSNHVYDSSQTMQDKLQLADQAAQNQNIELDMIATATTELSQAVNEISSNANNSSQSTINAKEQVVEGMSLVTQADQQINALANNVRASEALVEELHTSSDRIGEVLDVIGNIADQTNLLALNAAIEAARAGEHGRGFAVVADEVRTLARQTQDSTSNIQTLIDNVRNNTKQVFDVMAENRAQAEQSVENAQSLYEKLTSLTEQVTGIQEQSIQIADSTSQQSVALEDISQNLVSTKDFANSTTSLMDEASRAGKELQETTTNLLEKLKQFKTN
ncbi:methyl-accepting chemotaxis protein [Catenovulum sp. SM1970]|uniref:methyl-accepting chemotaxis protein n=1 Tax=Marinifaba aquimaris TaxID=2741323 RepID=UPI001571DCF1|nr:methyl-accepting chemotaxis protein [Marinifaba aquimaris]NTS78634.1 methyl-accepting chemotaxis protein [Marinifaba aquimaris]